jgi:hypothetical protein
LRKLFSPRGAEIFLGTKIVPARHARANDGRITRTFISRESVEKSTRLQAAPQRWQQVGRFPPWAAGTDEGWSGFARHGADQSVYPALLRGSPDQSTVG